MQDYFVNTKTGIVVNHELLKSWKKQTDTSDILYLQGSIGCGKTVMAQELAEMFFQDSLYVSCKSSYRDIITDYLEHQHDARYIKLIIIDDLQELALQKEEMIDLAELMLDIIDTRKKCKFFVVSRGIIPPEWKQLLLKKVIGFASNDELGFSFLQVKLLLEYHHFDSYVHSIGDEYFYTHYPLALDMWIRYEKFCQMEQTKITQVIKNDIYDYWIRIISRQPYQLFFHQMLRLSIYESFTKDTVVKLFGEKEGNLFFEYANIVLFCFEPSDDGNYSFLPYIKYLLQHCIDMRDKSEVAGWYYETAQEYEEKRNLTQALRCYYNAGKTDKVRELIILQAENADGSILACESAKYMDEIPEDVVLQNPDLMAAKAMLCSFRMQLEESDYYVERLRQFTVEHQENQDALKSYLRLKIMLPHGDADTLLDKFQECIDLFGEEDALLHHVQLTGGQPSILNGGIDLCSLMKDAEGNYLKIKKLIGPVLGKEGIGFDDLFYGEACYQRDNRTEALSYISRGMSAATLYDNIRMMYSSVGLIANLFMAENDHNTAYTFLNNMEEKSKHHGCLELLPNITCSKALLYLKIGDLEMAKKWLYKYDYKIFADNYISNRFETYIGAVVYLATNRETQALYQLHVVEGAALRYNRRYLLWKVRIMICIIYFRRGEEWKEFFFQIVKDLEEYGMYRVLMDEGAAVLPLWREMEWNSTSLADKQEFLCKMQSGIERMAEMYPCYLLPEKETETLNKQELRVLKLLAEGYTNTEISKELFLSIGTIKKYVSSILSKLQVENRTLAVKIAYQKKLIY